jgi:3-oxoacyl-[acyl-carrier-protein] synthase-3
MGTRIEAVATAHGHGHRLRRGALHLTDLAAKACLQRAHHGADQLDLLINAGLYKNGNAAEPALASIIQENIGANPGTQVIHGHHGTFSFDILNGGCGVLTAALLVDGFVGHGNARHGMIVAGDVDPSPSTSQHFPFSPAAGAILIGHTDDSSGFQQIELRTFSEHASLFGVQLRWDSHAGLLRRGRNVIEVHEDPSFASLCTDLATDVASTYLDRLRLRPDDIDLLIASQYPRSFALGVAHRLGIPAARVPNVSRELASTHTAGPIAALEAAFESGQFARARHTLFVTVGAGITVGVALYNQEVQ